MIFTVCNAHSNGIANLPRKGSRFGDNLLGYCKAKWIAYKYNLPFYLKVFPHAQELALAQKDSLLSAGIRKGYTQEVHVTRQKINWLQESRTLYYLSLNTKSIAWSITNTDSLFMQFRQELQELISPVRKPSLPTLPHDMISVAVHVRKGGGYDRPLLSDNPDKTEPYPTGTHYADQIWPLKFPPDTFYIDQIRYLYTYFGNQPLYVYIFTDDKNPPEIVRTFSSALSDCQLQFACRDTENGPDKNVIDDLMGLSIFDCLIRPTSNFSVCAQLIGNHQIIIWPKQYHWEHAQLIIDDVTVYIPSRTSSLCKNII